MGTIRGRIAGTGSFVPEKILTNKDLEKMVDTTDEWIKTRTGMSVRHISDENTATSDLATEAAKRALADAGVKPEEIDLIVVGTYTSDKPIPSTACFVQNNIGAVNAAAFDLTAACSGFIYSLTIANSMITSGEIKTALVIGAETHTKFVDWKDRATCVLFGDGAGAVVVKADETGAGVLSSYLWSDGSGTKPGLLEVPGGGSRDPNGKRFIVMGGNEVFKKAVIGMEKCADEAMKKANLKYSDISIFIQHQANIRIIDALAKRMELPAEKVVVNLEKYGNTSAASIPIALDEAVKNGRIKKGDVVEVTDEFCKEHYGKFFLVIGVDKPFLNAIVPTVGFLLSTISLPFVRKIWEKYR